MNITVVEFSKLLNNKNIIIKRFREHSKASEKYIDLKIVQPDGFSWDGSIPYFYRRTGLFIETPQELADYLNEIYPLFSKNTIDEFIVKEKARWEDEFKSKKITKPFFDKLINIEWNSVKYDLPTNPNWARRIQDIKELGYTLATDTCKAVKGKNENDTHITLVPIPRGSTTGYEVMSAAFKAKAIVALKANNIYELSAANRNGLIPDHKFPEIRWDEATRAENPEGMNVIEIAQKFQLIDNQRNQQKREVCRNCFQTNKRGIIYGINYFYQGNEDWPQGIPKIGKDAEIGCKGCGWYDIQKWRESLNEFIRNCML